MNRDLEDLTGFGALPSRSISLSAHNSDVDDRAAIVQTGFNEHSQEYRLEHTSEEQVLKLPEIQRELRHSLQASDFAVDEKGSLHEFSHTGSNSNFASGLSR